MNESHIADVWLTLKEFLDKKHIELAAERYVDLLADYGTSDQVFQECLGNESTLDAAINYYLDVEEYDTFDDEEEWDE